MQQAKDTLSEERHEHQASRQSLQDIQQQVKEAQAERQQLGLQVADLQLQLEVFIAEHSSASAALEAAEAKLIASEADKADADAQVGWAYKHALPAGMQSVASANWHT